MSHITHHVLLLLLQTVLPAQHMHPAARQAFHVQYVSAQYNRQCGRVAEVDRKQLLPYSREAVYSTATTALYKCIAIAIENASCVQLLTMLTLYTLLTEYNNTYQTYPPLLSLLYQLACMQSTQCSTSSSNSISSSSESCSKASNCTYQYCDHGHY
jgi:hypothetical protein